MSDLIRYTPEEMATNFGPIAVREQLGTVKTMADAIKADGRSLSVLRKHTAHDRVCALIELHLVAFQKSLNVHQKLDQFQMNEIANEILTSYYHLNVIEIAHVLQKAKRGDYGRIEYAINMPDVMQWFAQYAEKRVEHFMYNSNSESNEHKQNFEDSQTFTPEAMQALSELKDQFSAKEKFDQDEYNKYKIKYETEQKNENK